MEFFKTVVFDMDKLELQEIPIQKAFLPLLVNQDSNSDAQGNSHAVQKQMVCLKWKAISWKIHGQRSR